MSFDYRPRRKESRRKSAAIAADGESRTGERGDDERALRISCGRGRTFSHRLLRLRRETKFFARTGATRSAHDSRARVDFSRRSAGFQTRWDIPVEWSRRSGFDEQRSSGDSRVAESERADVWDMFWSPVVGKSFWRKHVQAGVRT